MGGRIRSLKAFFGSLLLVAQIYDYTLAKSEKINIIRYKSKRINKRNIMEELRKALEAKAAEAAQSAAALTAEDRIDDANLEKIRGNVYGIFVSVLQAAEKQSSDNLNQRELFERNLERIPSGWYLARDLAAKRGDTVRLVQEDVKLAAIDEVKQAFHELWR
jgi:hypothetical protein